MALSEFYLQSLIELLETSAALANGGILRRAWRIEHRRAHVQHDGERPNSVGRADKCSKEGTAEREEEERESQLSVVVKGVQAGVAVAPETWNKMSIYIRDIVGFATTSALSTPLQYVHLLNDLYILFDKTTANYDVCKVSLIGYA
ncbi:Speract receptor [Echinococcus granulosus]|uniref:Speract receptor n=1 Tax=Echinococcus granulosus TaxID=6210 RepID=W6U6K0_ECHGR|nr:Speract receptor [Echinococcus granulosus]EUB53957.1 Speract receptor [Echinococcus granulosus]